MSVYFPDMKLDYSSVEKICGDSKEVMVFGFTDTKYKNIIKLLNSFEGSSIEGCEYRLACGGKTLDGRVIQRICHSGPAYKESLVNIVYENYLRSKLNLPFIRVLFCIEMEDDEGHHYEITPERLSSRKPGLGKTSGEVRRTYWLCEEFKNEKIRLIAQETFEFVKVNYRSAGLTTLEKIDPPWKKANWKKLWAERRKQKKWYRVFFCRGEHEDWIGDLKKAISPPIPKWKRLANGLMAVLQQQPILFPHITLPSQMRMF